MKRQIATIFKEQFAAEPAAICSSSGRINLIGEHLDYNGGYVLPGSIDKCIMAAIKPNGTDKVRLHSVDMNDDCEFALSADAPAQQWARYVYGVCREMMKRQGQVQGFDAAFMGNVPLGAGLSSSAALESCFAFAINDLFNGNAIAKTELAKIGQDTEHNYCGVNCGIMDQFASVMGLEGKLVRINCETLDYDYVPFAPKGYRLVLIDTKVKHELVNSPYNQRRNSCERAAKALGVKLLCNSSIDKLPSVKGLISDEDYKRAEYVLAEQKRVIDVCESLKRDDYEAVGKLMYETHHGLSALYEVSCEELDYLNEVARECGVTGSRMMGGGFGGCTINLVKDELHDAFVAEVTSKFEAKFGHKPGVIDVKISDGAHKVC